MSKATTTVEGFAAEPRRSQTQAGKDVLTVAVAHTPRRKNRETGEFEDAGPTTWFEAAFWEQDAHAVAQVVSKGTLVTITGQPEVNVFTKQDGTTGATVRLKFATLGVVPRAQQANGPAQVSAPAPAVSEPSTGDWATYNDEAPF
ncbi:single-stranded DNA-binding protein [Paramicrobacterium sp. CJ85]|uniref:single-stranded DNA-binding protein n=1 Tax=Paramicrobacterium sp. CJ85 TaxID=3445355 RepID=UPI003F5EF414